MRQAGEVEHGPLLLPLGQRFAGEAAAGVLFPAADDVAAQQVGEGAEIGVGLEVFLGGGDAQGLLEGGFDLVEQGVDAKLQALVFIDQGVADQDTRHASVFLGETQEQGDDLLDLLETCAFFRGDLVDDAEQALFDELDEAFEHLRLAREVAVERGFGAIQFGGEGGGGDLFAFWRFEHTGQGLQDV